MLSPFRMVCHDFILPEFCKPCLFFSSFQFAKLIVPHLALGLKACAQGHNVLFKNAATLSTQLCEAKDNYHLGKLERTLAKADLLILDELSYLSFNRHQSELLFKVISDRSEKSSTIVTTNLPFSKWTDLFENTTMVAALIDRLTFHSHVLNMNGDSYRLKATMQDRN